MHTYIKVKVYCQHVGDKMHLAPIFTYTLIDYVLLFSTCAHSSIKSEHVFAQLYIHCIHMSMQERYRCANEGNHIYRRRRIFTKVLTYV